MRLLECQSDGGFRLTDNLLDKDVSRYPYAILSHRWGQASEEVTFEDIVEGSGRNKAGYEKIKFCGEQAAMDDLKYFWVDSCCIRKSSDAELSEAINSMYRWYSRAARCYVYLSDVSTSWGRRENENVQNKWEYAFRASEWFSRGWTLQELLAPSLVEFFSRERERLGDKRTLSQQIHEITGIALLALQGTSLSQFSVDERFKWAQNRHTTREEDWAYSLLGIFGTSMPLIYGEGRERAVSRLRNKINEALDGSSKNSTSYSQTSHKPLSTVPFRRDPDFVDRGDLLSQVDERCSQPAGRAALIGLGGVGKSQLVIEHAYRTRDRLLDTWVFWVHTSNAARFEQGYRDIADVVKIAERKDPKADIFKLVHDWLRGNEGKWLMILDNIDDASFLVDAQLVSQSQSSDSTHQVLRPLREYLPQSQNGSILITTRSRESALKLVEQKDIIMVDPMDKADAFELLDKKLESTVQRNDQDNAKLVAALEHMPLAIVQAAAYISQMAPRCSVRQYIEEFQKSDRKKSSLLNHEGGQLRRDGEAKNSIIITWQISFEHIRQTRPSAADLLSLMSFFDPQGIPEALVRTRSEEERQADGNRDGGEEDDGDDSQSESSEDDRFEADVQTLRNFSFVTLGANPTVFEMHKLVQLATRKWLEASEQFEKWKQQYVRNLYTKVPTGSYENLAKCAAIFPHVQSAISQRPKERDSLLQWASILYNGAWYAWQRGTMASAVEMSTKAMKTREKILGQEDEATLSSMGMVGLVYNMAGRWNEAEELDVQVMETIKKVLGDDHPNTLTSMGNLASTYRNQGRWKEAEELEVQVMETRKKVLSDDHPDTLTSMANLASTYRNQGRWKEAEELEVQVMETRKKVLGDDYLNTLTSMANLASTYWNQGRWKEAEKLQLDELNRCKRLLGHDHPDTLISMSNLARIFKGLGKDDDAIVLMQECSEKRKGIIGPDHPFTKASEETLNQWRMEHLRLDAST